jgi:hypothetical protein
MIARAALQTACTIAQDRPASTFAILVRAFNSWRVMRHRARKAERAERAARRRAAVLCGPVSPYMTRAELRAVSQFGSGAARLDAIARLGEVSSC